MFSCRRKFALLSLQTASSPLDPCTLDVDSFSLILTFYHLVSIGYRWLSGGRVSAFGLYPTYGVGVRRSVTPR
jgi:hypothetical protein